MATYKVIQDIEAEDKIVGALTLRQFIYAGVSLVCLYICFLAYSRHAQFLIIFFLPIAAAAGFFGIPWKGQQPTEIWALARLRFMIKPRVRIWDQDGAKDLVTVTAPKRIETRRPVRNLTQNEVRSRLKALADTIDSRGWATRNAAYGSYSSTWSAQNTVQVPGNAGIAVSMPNDDMFDDQNTVAQNFDALLAKSSQQKRERVIQQIAQVQNPQSAVASGATPLESILPPDPAPGQMQPMFQSPTLPAPVMAGYMGVPQQQYQAQYQQQYQTGQPMTMPAYSPPAMVAGPMPGQPIAPTQNLWFANGPAFPANPQVMAPMMAPTPAPMPGLVAPSQIAGDGMGQPAAAAASAAMPILPAPVMPSDAPATSPLADNPAAIVTDASPAPPGETVPALASAPTSAEVAQPVATDLPASIESDIPLPAAAAPTAEDSAASADIRERSDTAMAINLGHMRVLQPIGSDPIPGVTPVPVVSTGAQPIAAQQVTSPTDPAILELANNDDLDIATLARQANKEINKAPDEVEINLH